ncbi:MAG: substrate-binding domain-containing protein [Terriglobia bacterium]
MKKAIFPMFEKLWLTKTGERLEIISSFAGSGTITNQLLMGVPAEIALLSLEWEATRLSASSLVQDKSWHRLPFQGVLNQTPIVILVRPGNPLGISDFSDLARPGIRIIHPDPATSGGANWAIVAEYGSTLDQQGTILNTRTELLAGIWRNVVARASSARAARTMFDNGFGDALVTYEQELLLDRAEGLLRGEIIYPKKTVLCENTLVLLDKYITTETRSVLNAFIDFLWSDQAQRIFLDYGFRSVDDSLNKERSDFGKIETLSSITEYGGWGRAKPEIIDEIWKNRALKKEER